MHKLLDRVANSVGDYANYQIESGAQVVIRVDKMCVHLPVAAGCGSLVLA